MTCFSSNTLVTTDNGDIPASLLRPGDKVLTRDNGYQAVRWVGERRMNGRFLLDNPHLRPVLVRAGAFGNGLPCQDIMLSPNSRLPIEEPGSGLKALIVGGQQQMVAVKHLINHRDIMQIDVLGLKYAHIMFTGHQIIATNGFWVESFKAGDYSLGAVGNAQRNEILEIFPELRQSQLRSRQGETAGNQASLELSSSETV